jgi:transcriptional antiterminator NusG
LKAFPDGKAFLLWAVCPATALHARIDTLVRNVPRVMGFIGGTSDRPAPISDKEADAILNRLQDAHDKPRPKTLFEPGEMVRVADGPFADFNGTVEEVDYEKSRVKVSVLIFGRSTPVELDFGQVEKG